MSIKIKRRNEQQNLKKVLIYGLDGTGKSTFAYNYCKENNLNPVVIDIDDTNYTPLPLIEFDRTDDNVIYKSLKNIIRELKTLEYDTIILDGVSSLLELLVSNGRGMNKYGDRTARWNKILNLLLDTNKNLIFIGQIDMVVIEGESSKAVVNVNSIVNEKYRCVFENNKYSHIVEKYRVVEDNSSKQNNTEFVKANEVAPQTDYHEKALKHLKWMKKHKKDLNLTNAKLEVALCQKKGLYTVEEAAKIAKELDILLNGYK